MYALPDELITPFQQGSLEDGPERKAAVLPKGQAEVDRTDKLRQRRWKKQQQRERQRASDQRLRHAAVVKGDAKAQRKLDVAHAERQLKSLKNVKFIVGRKHANKTIARLDSAGQKREPRKPFGFKKAPK